MLCAGMGSLEPVQLDRVAGMHLCGLAKSCVRMVHTLAVGLPICGDEGTSGSSQQGWQSGLSCQD